MRVLMMGDVVGKPGRRAVEAVVPGLRREMGIDFVIANGENIAGGLGLTPEAAREMLQAGVDVLTAGNHVWDNRAIIPYMEGELPILRPVNFPPADPGRGWMICKGVLVINVIGRVFMSMADDPFRAVDRALEQAGGRTKVIIVECHAEATSEKGAMGWYLNGKVSAVLGTHTHVGTVDARVLPQGTAFVTDIGMVGPRDSIIGNTPADVLQRFRTQVKVRLGIPEGPVMFHSVLVDVDETTGKARSIIRIDREVP
ncbi:MAG: YmdB family metallophosphoesterase [Dehalococcoidia bacterium]|nr:YmdB family metallophosphoesterase [Dehalococcoidia bacterium]